MKDRSKKPRLVSNAKRTTPTKFDPTRTTTLRRAFISKLRRKFARLRKAIYDLLVVEDALGLKKSLTYNHIEKLPSGKYRLLSHTGKNLGTFDSHDEAAKHEGEVEYFKYAANSFCATGEGGGIDPSCSPNEGDGDTPFTIAMSSARKIVIQHGKDTEKERGIFLRQDGSIIEDTGYTGGYGGIEPTKDTEKLLTDLTNHITVVHNHPKGQSLSGGDIMVLAKWPGLKTIEAVDHSGVTYSASRGDKYPKTIEGVRKAYDKAYEIEREKMLKRRDKGEISQEQVNRGVDHNTMINLAKKGVIKYSVIGRFATANSFCPTGPGGGVDPSCSSQTTSFSETDDLVQSIFEHKSTPFVIRFVILSHSPNKWEINFGIGDSESYSLDMSRTGKSGHDAISIFRKVGNVVSQFINKYKPSEITFTAEKLVPSRVKLYDKLSKVLSETHGYSLSSQDDQIERRYFLRKPEISNNHLKLTFNERWRFNTTPEQLEAFKEWLKTQVDYYVTGMTDEELWRKFIESGFKKGAGRAFDDTKPQLGWTEAEGAFYAGTKDQFLKSAFGQPESLSKVQLLAARTFDELEGMSADMQNKLGRILVDGLTKGNGPISIAREMSNQLNLSMTRAETIARTELIRAHAEGQLVGMEELGVDEVGVMVEWSTAGDDRVCELCEPMEGVVLKIEEARGMIPRHPNCRCAFVPANVAEPTDDQKRGKCKIMAAVRTSAALGKDDFSTAVPVTKERPKSVLPVITNTKTPAPMVVYQFSQLLAGARK